MADGDVYDALSGLNFTPVETPWGIGAQTLASSLPNLVNPYGSVGSNLAVTLGGALLAGLAGYQARQQATDWSMEANRAATQMLEMPAATDRLNLIESLSNPTIKQSLLGVNTRLASALAQQQLAAKAKQAELRAAAEFEMSPLGTELAARKTQQAMDIAAAGRTRLGTEKPEKDWFQTIPAEQRAAIAGASGSITAIKDLANQFRALKDTGVELKLKELIPGSPQDLAMSKFETLVPGIAKLLGQLGNLNIYEQQALKDALEGKSLSGSESIAKRLDQLAELAQRKITETVTTYKTAAAGGGEAVLQGLESGSTDKIQKLQQLQAQLAELKRMRAQAGK